MKTAAATVVIVVLLAGNYVFAERYLLRLNLPRDPIADIPKHLAPIATPLVISTRTVDSQKQLPAHFLDALGLTNAVLPKNDSRLIPIADVARVNPYPQPLAVTRGETVDYLSFGYLGVDQGYHQVTYYWGESDSTPSLLVRKVRGSQTGEGDYFVRYTVFLSNDLQAQPLTIESRTGAALSWQAPPRWPRVDDIEWSSYDGGSYNGFEEMGFAAVAAPIEFLFGVGVLRTRRRSALPTAA